MVIVTVMPTATTAAAAAFCYFLLLLNRNCTGCRIPWSELLGIIRAAYHFGRPARESELWMGLFQHYCSILSEL